MRYPIPANAQEVLDLQHQPIDEEVVAAAIAGVIRIARAQGRTLEDLSAELLAEDGVLDKAQRRWLQELVTHAWENLP
ncbi:hypothetical protein OOK60_16950 [Trichothermofontia sichuanensis B231]|uniref:hypothetical protein n=1 Tax=Trichothermofontia sichuanensis TaxID=3045816 RepID=UPI002248174C|nr:hypothetical protein [Trichothermofontia sichuanensis]UZQ54150.1 hypothetical protein OOK60_16950 [Trichothermofontia sichuanensis B231]